MYIYISLSLSLSLSLFHQPSLIWFHLFWPATHRSSFPFAHGIFLWTRLPCLLHASAAVVAGSSGPSAGSMVTTRLGISPVAGAVASKKQTETWQAAVGCMLHPKQSREVQLWSIDSHKNAQEQQSERWRKNFKNANPWLFKQRQPSLASPKKTDESVSPEPLACRTRHLSAIQKLSVQQFAAVAAMPS